MENDMVGNNRGLTLIEIAVVLVVLGILLGIGASMVGPLTKRAKLHETNEIVKQVSNAVVSYVTARRELPCDATETCTAPDNRFNTLGTRRDSYGSDLYYMYSGNLRQDGPATADICSLSTTNITLRVCHQIDAATGACSSFDTIPNVAYIVLSRGENMNKQTNGNGRITAATTITVYDAGIDNVLDGDPNDTNFAAAPPNTNNRRERYDDIVVYVTLSELKGKFSCSGCIAYEIYNSGGTGDFLNNLTGACYSGITNDSFVTSVVTGSSIERHSNGSGCRNRLSSVTYSTAVSADANRNCRVNYPDTLPLTDR